MKNLKMFCITIEPSHVNFIRNLGYTPVGLGNKNFSKDCLEDKIGENISLKNKNYGEYTFHYWLWKNYLDKIKDEDWIGFCQYRKFWSIKEQEEKNIDINNLKEVVLSDIPSDFEDYDVILGKPFFINERKFMKFIKKGLPLIISNPKFLFNKDKRNIKFHFDLMHGRNNLSKAIDLLDVNHRESFRKFVESEVSFNPHNMFICKSKKILTDYYKDIFKWLISCEKIFGFKNLSGYGMTRIYGFLAERFMSYWFKKNLKYKELPIIFYDPNDHLKQ
tara:strand:- start:2289 stop:3116 length:828 start_codon:yes stop_codon:yes gene_type:complete